VPGKKPVAHDPAPLAIGPSFRGGPERAIHTIAMKKLLAYFVRGCLVLAPLALTLYIAWLVFATIDQVLPIGVPGLGFVLTVALITLVGFLTSNVIGKTVLDQTEKFFTRVPLVKLLYTSIRDLINAFVGDKKRFDKPVAVSLLPGSSAMALGFVTRQSLQYLETHGGVAYRNAQSPLATHVAVYFPQSYNFAGNLLLVSRESVLPLELPSADMMAFIVSGGVSGFGMGEHGQSLPPPAMPTAQTPASPPIPR
jgi:uncharacterized membrane protein